MLTATAMEIIRSRQNAQLRRARAAAAGKEDGVLVLEGDRLVDEAIAAGLRIELCLVASDRPDRAAELDARLAARAENGGENGGAAGVRLVDPELLQQASSLKTSPGVLAIAEPPAERALASLDPKLAPLVAIACGISDPGNLGALARTAEAAGAGALVLVGGASPWSPKALRGSMGSLLRLPVARAGGDDSGGAAGDVRVALSAAGYRQLRAATRGGKPFDRADWTPPVALWLTSEIGELPEDALAAEPVTIPMAAPVESLNVTVAAAVLLFAARSGAGQGGGS